ncbi:response regulator RpfG family c-di-GMP phosphodiesterase [Carboxydothermus ferrireducens DSM 11255]|uniref:Response regulator RpfG family c-di-GMP phosphodiesterase n=1 Tax=Carboxydothermus ferrireducens DSM 11255 TaxID=1119529 RepID=A0ABX2R8B6_9THEO|nr:response regulator RpfG family c-di-GMP phosphodiesterase [Carboxydothermus ferrireducens DSM 11255]
MKGAVIDDRFEQMRDIAPIIRYPHERWDGEG